MKFILFVDFLLFNIRTYITVHTLQGKFEGRDMSMSLYGLKDFSSSEDETLQVCASVDVSVGDSISDSVIVIDNIMCQYQ